MHDLELDKSDVGMISTYFSLSYGFSKFIWSALSDRLSPKILFPFGLVMSSIFTILFTFGANKYYLSSMWFLNGCVQGSGWPALTVIIYDSFEINERGTAWSTVTAVTQSRQPHFFFLLIC
jgi:MFS transporter, OPA family, sugar phosphate sensor protein UhpC